MNDDLPRRVYRRELCAAIGCGITWFRELQKRGVIPQGQRDPGGKREWFTSDRAREIIEKMNAVSPQGIVDKDAPRAKRKPS